MRVLYELLEKVLSGKVKKLLLEKIKIEEGQEQRF